MNDDEPNKNAKANAAGVLAVMLGLATSSNPAQATDYHLPYNTPTTILEWGICYVVTNYVGPTKFVAASTPTEWASFYNSPGTAWLSTCSDGGGCGNCSDGGG